jgi:hypothetical protein
MKQSDDLQKMMQEALNQYKVFLQWLKQFMKSEKFLKIANEFIQIETQLKTEPAGRKMSELLKKAKHTR